MTRALALFLLTACTDVQYGAAFNFGSGGIGVSPSVAGAIGAARIAISN